MDKPSARFENTLPAFKGYQVEIYLKSGQTINARCEDFTVKWNPLTGEYVGYEFKGLKEPRRVDFNPGLIAGYIVK